MKNLRIGIALQTQHGFGACACSLRVVAHLVDARPWRSAVDERRAHHRAGTKINRNKIVVDRQRRYSGAIAPHCIVYAPTRRVAFGSEIAVIRDDAARNFSYARRHHLVGQLSQSLLRRAVMLSVIYKRQ